MTATGFFILRLLDGFQNTADHAAGRLPSLIAQAGFSNVKVAEQWRTAWGSLQLLTAEIKEQHEAQPSASHRR